MIIIIITEQNESKINQTYEFISIFDPGFNMQMNTAMWGWLGTDESIGYFYVFFPQLLYCVQYTQKSRIA